MDLLADEPLRLAQELTSKHRDTRSAVANHVVLRLGRVDDDLGRSVLVRST